MDNTAVPIPGHDGPIVTDAEVVERVDALIEPSARRRRALWLTFVDTHGYQAPVVVPIDGLPTFPDPRSLETVTRIFQRLLGPGDAAILALVRPGEAVITDFDRRWCRSLHDASRLRDVAIRMFCSVTPHGTRRLTLDDACGPPSDWNR